MKRQSAILIGFLAVFAACFWLPVGSDRFRSAIMESLHLVRWYAREHVLLCLVPALFIAGAIGVFISSSAVMRYLGPKAPKALAYGVASVSGSILAVCSCTVLPLFAGIHRMGAGLGPAVTFLYSGPAINVLAIILTARILGLELGIARAVGAVLFSIVIGLAMHWIYRKEEQARAVNLAAEMPTAPPSRPLWKNATFFAAMVAVLVFANWGAPNEWNFSLGDGRTITAAVIESPESGKANDKYTLKLTAGERSGQQIHILASDIETRQPVPGLWTQIWSAKWVLTAIAAGALGVVLVLWFGLAWWKVILAALPCAVLAMLLPGDGLWVMLPFAAAVAGLAIAAGTSKGEGRNWVESSWGFTKQILPLLLAGVVVAGLLLGRPGHEGLIPSAYVEMLVGDTPDALLAATGWSGGAVEPAIRAGWNVWTNLFASAFGAFMYFATLTEVPILQGLLGAGMGKGPALALLLAGPALSLPNMLVIRSVMGTRKTATFVALVIVMATISGLIFGAFF